MTGSLVWSSLGARGEKDVKNFVQGTDSMYWSVFPFVRSSTSNCQTQEN